VAEGGAPDQTFDKSIAEMIRQGHTQVATLPPNVKAQELLLQLPREAREVRRGLWGHVEVLLHLCTIFPWGAYGHRRLVSIEAIFGNL
jgi:hypothetical protein